MRVQLDRHRVVGRRGQDARRVDRQRPSGHGPLGGRPAPDAAVPRECPLSRGARRRRAGPPLRHALALPAVRDGARHPQVASPRPARGASGLLRGGGRLGASQLVRAGRGRTPVRVFLAASELVRVFGGRASGGPRARRADRSEQLRKDPGVRRRRGVGARRHLRQRRRGSRGPRRLHAMAQRSRRHRGRRHRDPSRGGRLPRRDRGGESGAGRRLAQPPRPRRVTSHGHGRDVRLRRPWRHGAEGPGSAVAGHQCGSRQRRLSLRDLPRDRHRLRDGARDPHHVCRGSWAGSSTCRSNSPSASATSSWRTVGTWGWPQSDSTR